MRLATHAMPPTTSTTERFAMPLVPPDRISLADIVKTIKPVMSRSTFYGSKDNRGARWTEIQRLDLRRGHYGITADRQSFERWYRTIQGELASTPHEVATRLGLTVRKQWNRFWIRRRTGWWRDWMKWTAPTALISAS